MSRVVMRPTESVDHASDWQDAPTIAAPSSDYLPTVYLHVTRGPGRGQTFSVGAGPFIIGRADDADLCLPFPEVSRKHARLQYVGMRLVVQDLESHNGTFLDGHRVHGDVEILPGRRLRIGTSTLLVSRFSKPTRHAALTFAVVFAAALAVGTASVLAWREWFRFPVAHRGEGAKREVTIARASRPSAPRGDPPPIANAPAGVRDDSRPGNQIAVLVEPPPAPTVVAVAPLAPSPLWVPEARPTRSRKRRPKHGEPQSILRVSASEAAEVQELATAGMRLP